MDYVSSVTEKAKPTLQWALVYLMRNPDVLQEVQSEIEDVIGSHRTPSWKDRHNMPYTDAVITEVLRIHL